MMDSLPGAHGAVGEVLKVSSSTLVVAEPNNLEKVIRVSSTTAIRKFRDTITILDIKVGDFISVLGEANGQGEIDAKLVRIMPK
jgi:hypothetical protein